VVPGERVKLGHFTPSLPLQRRRSRRGNHSTVPVEKDRRAALPHLQAREESRASSTTTVTMPAKIEVYDDWCRGDDRRPITIREMRKHAPARAVLGDGALVPGSRRRIEVAGVIWRPRNITSPGSGV
jgi:hypothetical protein